MLASAALLAATAAPASAAYPAREVLDAFAVACAATEDTANTIRGAEADGWERLAPDADTPASRLVRQAKETFDLLAPEARMLDGAEFRKTVAGRTLYLAVSGVKADAITSRGCRVFDFAATRALATKDLTAWAGRAPLSRPTPVAGVTKFSWVPGLKPAHQQMEVYFVAPGRSPLAGFDTSGLTLVASALE